jgi:glyoxylase-like metal-dependent hydrolase (beta-lactamase superfamily II)
MPGAALLLLPSLLAPALQAPPPPPPTIEKVADDFYVIRSEGGNTSVYITDEGLVLVDPKFDRNHAELIASVTALSTQPIKYVFNTHAHEDHTGGNVRLAPAIVVGQANQRAIMLKRNLAGPPQVTYGGELHLTLGGKEVVARYFGRCHTAGDSFVFFPARRTLATGDCITRGNGRGVPNPPKSSRILVDYDNGGSFTEAIKTVEQVLKWDFDTVVPGHGPLGTKADIVRWHDGLSRLQNRVSALLREGKGRDVVLDVLVKEFEWDPGTVADRANGLMSELKP